MRKYVALLLTLSFLGLGCGGGGPVKPKLYPVTGKVTVGGKPLTDCTIGFASLPGAADVRGYSSPLNQNGEYSLTDQQDGKSGAAAGKYKVTLTLSPEAAKKAMMSGAGQPGYSATTAFPPEYTSVETSPREVEVKAESNTINIEL